MSDHNETRGTMSGLNLDAIEAIATENPGGPMLVLPETLLSLVAEVRRLRAEVERMADTLAELKEWGTQ